MPHLEFFLLPVYLKLFFLKIHFINVEIQGFNIYAKIGAWINIGAMCLDLVFGGSGGGGGGLCPHWQMGISFETIFRNSFEQSLN